jgi:hypothetical protein
MNQACPCFQKYILITFILMTSVGQAQTRFSDIDNSRIKQKSICNFLKGQIEKGIVTFEDFSPSVTEQTDTSQFDFNVHHFHLRQALPITWNTYITAHPAQIWQGKVVSCGFVYSHVSKRVIFANDRYPGLEPGQIFFVEMRVLCGLIKFPVCFMVTKIDESQHSITFSYVSSGSSKGSQTIRLNDNGKGGTDILHSSIHKTEHVLRDKTLYPIYHRKAIKEVHRNIRNTLEVK